MSVWIVCPSARPVEHVREWAAAWRDRGYHVAILRNMLTPGVTPFPTIISGETDVVLERFEYLGYAKAVNEIVTYVMENNADAEWFIAAGDDIFPDPNKTAEEIARECRSIFFSINYRRVMERGDVQEISKAQQLGFPQAFETFGVMQPTGDRWGEDPNAANPKHRSPYIDRVCGSAWIGREFARRINQGKGPLWPEYFHMSVDRELQGVALKYGVLWQRPDLTHLHQHWGRPKPGEKMGHAINMPEFLRKANEGMTESERLCDQRERDGFPGSEPL